MKKLELNDILGNTSELKDKKVWYVSIIWRPNSWKSTFINALIWEKVVITSNIPQTTRNKILAIYNDEESQIVFLDTPWVHESSKSFNIEMNSQAISSIADADVILYFIDTSRIRWTEEVYIEWFLMKAQKPIITVYTKNDLKAKYSESIVGQESISISSITREWFPELLNSIKSKLSSGPILFPEEYYTKQDMRFRISEIIREKLYGELKEELPHSIFVSTEEIDETTQPWLLRISAYIYTETDSQKYIVIGKWWTLLSRVWKLAREELESILWTKIFLALRVKVRKWWRKDEKLLKKMFE